MIDEKGKFVKNSIPWNKGTKGICKSNKGSFKKGQASPCGMLGKKHSKETKNIMSIKSKGRKHTDESKNKIRNSVWKGGVTYSDGYRLIYDPKHPNNSNGYVEEHRLIIERIIGRMLKSSEPCHHVNEIRDDNRIENLMVFINNGSHARFHKIPHLVKSEEIIFDGRNYIN